MTFQDNNGNSLELSGSFAITKQAVSFFNMSIRGDVSINFEVDNNSANRKTLGYYGPQMNSQVAFTKQAFNRMIDGNVLDSGYIVIQDETENILNCFYVSGNSNWVQLVRGLITELDFTGVTNGIDYVKWIVGQTISDQAAVTDGIIFPLADWNYNNKRGNALISASTSLYYSANRLKDARHDGNTFPMIEFYPCFYLSTLMSEIFKQNGLKLAGNIIDDPIYKSLIVTPHNGLMKRTVTLSNIYATGSGQVYVAPIPLVAIYNSFTETQDIDNLFANSRYTANKKTGVIITLKCVSAGAGLLFPFVYKNGIQYVRGADYSPLSSQIFDVIGVKPGDYLEIYTTCNTNFPVPGSGTLQLDIKIEEAESIGANDYVGPKDFLPSLQSIDVIKFAFSYFGCSVYFNEFSKTITANIIEKINTSSAADWSEYYLSNRNEYTVSQAKNNFILYNENSSDSNVVAYNLKHTVKYGSGNIQTGNTLKDQNTIVTFPFSASFFDSGLFSSVPLSNVPLVNLVDSTAVIFTIITNSGAGISQFTVTDSSVFKIGEVLRVTNSAEYSLGYFIVYSVSSTTTIQCYFPFYASDTGIIWKQEVKYNEVGPKILSVNNSPVTDFSISGVTSTTIVTDGAADTVLSNIPITVFSKKVLNIGIDNWKNNLAIDNPDSGGFTDPTIKELYFNKIGRFFQNPNVRAQMLIPNSVFQGFDFSNFIYLRTEKLTGYFFVDSIVNYQNSNTPVEVNLYML